MLVDVHNLTVIVVPHLGPHFDDGISSVVPTPCGGRKAPQRDRTHHNS
jgi:hypothetical protein